MQEQIGEYDIAAVLDARTQPVAHVRCENVWFPPDRAEAGKGCRRHNTEAVEQCYVDIGPTLRAPLGDAQHQGTVAGAEFQHGPRRKSPGPAIEQSQYDRQRCHCPVNAPQIVSRAKRERVVFGESIQEFRLNTPRKAVVPRYRVAGQFTPPLATRRGN
jgi:hypothetical protein